MRKLKKINGYLVVRFNEREKREYETLGTYGVIDAELYTGHLEIDRDVFEYEDADSLEAAIEQARGLESELDVEEPERKVTVITETAEDVSVEEVDAQMLIAGWEQTLRGLIENRHHPEVDKVTATHELQGYKVALTDLGMLPEEECYTLPDVFRRCAEPEARETFAHLDGGGAPARNVYALGLALEAECPDNDCAVYRNIFQMARELDEALDTADGYPALVLRGALRKEFQELRRMYRDNYAVQKYRAEHTETEPPGQGGAPREECPLKGPAGHQVSRWLEDTEANAKEGPHG
jgi:hypothetical protein